MLPLCRSGLHSAPWPPSACARLLNLIAASRCREKLLVVWLRRAFPTTLIVIPTRRFRLAAAGLWLKPFTCFRFAAPCEVDDVLGVHATPEPFRPAQCPLAAYRLRQAPMPHRGAPLPEPLYGRSGPAALSPIVHRLPVRSASPSRASLPLTGPYDTAFDRSAPVSPGRILGMHATPAPRSGAVLPESYRVPVVGARSLRSQPFA